MMRRSGKSQLQEWLVEEALNAGKTVMCYSHDGVTIKKRRKHLTCMEFRRYDETPPVIL